jgi:hypothetical protein
MGKKADTLPYKIDEYCIFHARIIGGIAYLRFIHNPSADYLGF